VEDVVGHEVGLNAELGGEGVEGLDSVVVEVVVVVGGEGALKE
jgi:hypothetical protein